MKRWSILSAAMLACILLVLGCSRGGLIPTMPSADDLTAGQAVSTPSQNNLWGYYDVYVDVAGKSANAVLNRDAMYAANVTTILNGKSAAMGFKIFDTVLGPGDSYLDIDLDVKLTHPFPGQTQYNGYDVRGIFMGNGSKVMAYNPKLKYADLSSINQVMYDFDADLSPEDPYTGKTGSPDGYTRWWNHSEFNTSGLFGYTQGTYATKYYVSNATLNPYKYFADGLSADEDLWSFLSTTTNHGVFSAGKSNSRNYYIRFPIPSPNVKFAYAVMANWKGDKPEDHPANAPEAQALNVKITPNVYFASPTDNGGKLKLDLSVFDWDAHVVSGVMTDYKFIVESTVLSTPYVATTSDMMPTDGTSAYSTYHVEIPADHVTSKDGQEFWVIVEDQNSNYKNEFGVTNFCGNDKLAAFFRNDLEVSPTSFNHIPVIDSGVDGPQGPIPGSTTNYSVTAHDEDGETLAYNWILKDKESGISDPSYNGVPGNPDGTISIDWSAVLNAGVGKSFDLLCTVTDNHSAPVPATTLTITLTTLNDPPVIESGVSGELYPVFGSTETYNVVATDDNGDNLTYYWTVKDKLTGNPIPTYAMVPGNPPGSLSIDWTVFNGFATSRQYDISCIVTDTKSPPVDATTLLVTVNSLPVITSGVTGQADPAFGSTEPYTVVASDVNGDTLSYSWTVTDKATGVPVTNFDSVPGNPPGTLSIHWTAGNGFVAGNSYDISCTVTDSKSDPVPATTLTVTINIPPVIESGVTGTDWPVFGSTETYYVVASDDNGDTLSYNWTVTDKSSGNPVFSYDGVPGNPPGSLSISWTTGNGFTAGQQYDISCSVTDGKSNPVDATPLTATTNNAPFAQFSVITPMPTIGYDIAPVTFQSYSYDLDPGESATLSYHWDFDGDFIYDETSDDSIDSGTVINPTHDYGASWVGTVHLKVIDIHNAVSNIASAPVNITVDTCSYDLPTSHSWNTSQSVSSGSFTDSHIAPMPTRAASTMRIIYPYSTNKLGACNAGGSGGGNGYTYVTSSATNSGGTIARAIITSSDRIIYSDAGSSNSLYYCDWSGSAFGTMHNAWGTTIPNYSGVAPAASPWRMAITEDDKPIILVPYVVSGTTTLVMYVWTGSGWGSAIALPTALRAAIGDNWANYSSYINDMDYDPTTGDVLIVTSYNYHEGIYAISTTGTLKWSEANLWTPSDNTTKLGVEVPKVDAKCRIVIFLAGDSMHSNPGMIRSNPLGGLTVDQWLPTGAGSNDIDSGYYSCLVPPNGSVTKWRFWGGSGYSSDDAHFVYREMPSDF
jgi:hypothetical protein